MGFATAQVGRLAAGVTAGVALALAGCGEDEEPVGTTAPAVTAPDDADPEKAPGTEVPADEPAPDPATDRDAIRETLGAVLTAGDGDRACGELVTARYLRRGFGDEAGCRAAQRKASAAGRVSVRRIVILPDSVAQAQVRPGGGIYEGEVLRAELVLDTGIWRLDSLRSNVPVGP